MEMEENGDAGHDGDGDEVVTNGDSVVVIGVDPGRRDMVTVNRPDMEMEENDDDDHECPRHIVLGGAR